MRKGIAGGREKRNSGECGFEFGPPRAMCTHMLEGR